MLGAALAVVGGSVLGSMFQSDAAAKAAKAQAGAAEAGIKEQRRQFDAMQKLLTPYVGAGSQAVGELGRLVGLRGDTAQAGEIRALESSPLFASRVAQGENAILQNASATGGLRGGNVQAALGQFRPALLSEEINRRYQQLFGITQLGQSSAAGVGSAGIQTGTNIANLLADRGAAQAGGALAQGQAVSNVLGVGSTLGGMYLGAGGAGRTAPYPGMTAAETNAVYYGGGF